MKKVLLIASLFVVTASSAFAAVTSGALASAAVTGPAVRIYGGVASAAASSPTPLIKFSTGVCGSVVFTNNTEYLIATKHDTGSKIFGTNNLLTNIYWKQASAVTLGSTGAILGFTTAASTNFVGGGWTSY